MELAESVDAATTTSRASDNGARVGRHFVFVRSAGRSA